jgi:nicotinate-nucleotide adenylyltransferase
VNERAGIMGGTFDPPHLGHIKIAESFLDSGLIDRLIIVPAYVPPHRENGLSSYSLRLEMTCAAFKNTPVTSVSDIESRLPTPSYTYGTVTHLMRLFPKTDFFLCMGSDSLNEFRTWHKYRDLLDICNLIVAERPGYARESLPSGFTGKVSFVPHEPVPISATVLREQLQNGEDVGYKVPQDVLKIIHQEGLYSG